MLAEREGVIQNAFIEQAVEHESLIRGAMVADDLARSSRRIAALTEEQHRALSENAIAAFAAGEAQPDPVQVIALHAGRDVDSKRSRDSIGVLAAFETAGTERVVTRAVWNDDHLADQNRIAGNARRLIDQLASATQARMQPTSEDVRRWHEVLYVGCAIPVVGFVGHFRGDPTINELVDYEVGVGATHLDGYPDRVGIWARDVDAEVDLDCVHRAALRTSAVRTCTSETRRGSVRGREPHVDGAACRFRR